jgi:bifunctional N-acetylglucosamine-1-phosphate-uridyltransferase/glucosamine-1-phosphate-acetyltransferase GlmU-like protein
MVTEVSALEKHPDSTRPSAWDVILPLAGSLVSEQESVPRVLTDVGDRTMIERVLENLGRIENIGRYIFVVREEDCLRFGLDAALKTAAGTRGVVVALKGETAGAACSALMAVDVLDFSRPLLIANSDQVIEADLNCLASEFLSSEADAGVLCVDALHPRWSYVRTDCRGDVIEVVEKRAVSRDAIAGFYMFRTAGDFVSAAAAMIQKGRSAEGKYFVAPCLNEILLKEGGRVWMKRIPKGAYSTFYTPDAVRRYEASRLGVQFSLPAEGSELSS